MKTLEETNPSLYAEVQRELLSGEMSSAAHVLRKEELAVVADKLRTAIVASTCECGEDDCSTYRFLVPDKPKGSAPYYTVRFHVRGELILGVDGDGDIHKVERLCDAAGGRPASVFVL